MDLRLLIFSVLFSLVGGTFVCQSVLRQSHVDGRYFTYHGSIILLFGFIADWIAPPLPPLARTALIVFFLAVAGQTYFAVKNPNIALLFSGLGSFLVPVVLKGSLPVSSVLYLNVLLSSLLMGFTMGSMLLGHWYLIQPKLDIEELVRTTRIMLWLTGIRFLFGTVSLILTLRNFGEMEIYRYLFSSTPGLFSLMRWTWGLLAPAFLGYLIWKTVKIRSTQSATGILYISVICVMTGEILSQYLAFMHGIPI